MFDMSFSTLVENETVQEAWDSLPQVTETISTLSHQMTICTEFYVEHGADEAVLTGSYLQYENGELVEIMQSSNEGIDPTDFYEFFPFIKKPHAVALSNLNRVDYDDNVGLLECYGVLATDQYGHSVNYIDNGVVFNGYAGTIKTLPGEAFSKSALFLGDFEAIFNNLHIAELMTVTTFVGAMNHDSTYIAVSYTLFLSDLLNQYM